MNRKRLLWWPVQVVVVGDAIDRGQVVVVFVVVVVGAGGGGSGGGGGSAAAPPPAGGEPLFDVSDPLLAFFGSEKFLSKKLGLMVRVWSVGFG